MSPNSQKRMIQVLRAFARKVSSALAYNPRLHATLKGAFLHLPEKLRGWQMVYDRLRELGISRHQDVTFCVVGANDGITNAPLYSFAKRYRWKGIPVEPVPSYFAEWKKAYEGVPVVLKNVAIHRTESKMTIHYVDPSKADLPAWAKGVGSYDKSKLETLSELPQRVEALTQIEVERCDSGQHVAIRRGLHRKLPRRSDGLRLRHPGNTPHASHKSRRVKRPDA